jgi:diacylglycerol kinase family enzyme
MNPIVVFNDKSGADNSDSARPTEENLREAFAASGVSAEIFGASGDALGEALRAAIARKPERLFVGGGDGTQSAAAGLLAGTSIVLGVLPLGTLNHFARDLGIPQDWREAIPALVNAPVHTVDVAEVNGRVFINNCSLGSYADAVRRRDALQSEKGHGKWRAMLAASWAVFRESRRFRLQISMPDGSTTLRTPLVVVANNRYTGSLFSSSLRPRIDEGRLWLYTTRAHRRWELVKIVWHALTRKIETAPELEEHDFTEAQVTTSRETIPAAADGELIDVRAPFRFKIRPGALRVLVPPPPAK